MDIIRRTIIQNFKEIFDTDFEILFCLKYLCLRCNFYSGSNGPWGAKGMGGKRLGGKRLGGKRPGGQNTGGQNTGGKRPGGKRPGGKSPRTPPLLFSTACIAIRSQV